MSESRSVVSDSLRCHGLYSPWNSPGQNTGMGSHSLPQGIFPTQGLNPGLLHGRKIIYHPSNQGSILLLPFNLNTVYMLYSNKNMFLIFKKRFKMMWAQVLISRFRRGWKSKFHFLHTASFNFLNKQ